MPSLYTPDMRKACPFLLFGLVLAVMLPSLPSHAEDKKKGLTRRARYIQDHYVKFERRVPMRDGAKLFTSVYLPRDHHKKRYPILLLRTPYRARPYGANRYPEKLGPSEAFERAGYIFVIQDVRGQFMSEGVYVNMRPHIPRKRGKKMVDESSDAYDTISWLLKNVPDNNGRVGMYGISYPGFYASCGAINGHPALKAVSPQAPIADWFFDDMHRHGALVLPLSFSFLSVFGVPRAAPGADWPERFDFGTPDGYQFFMDLGPLSNVNARHFKGKIPFWDMAAAHPNYDRFWQARNILPHLKGIRAAVLVVGGWYDMEDLYGTLATYRAIEAQNPRADNRLVMGPWFHGGWARSKGDRLGQASFGSNTSHTYRDQVELPFFEHHLKEGPRPALPEALIFETGANRWRRFSRWPPAGSKRRPIYLGAAGKLSARAPTGGAEATDSYVSDPRKPVPYTMTITTKWAKTSYTEDQRFAGWRPDVLTYRGEVLQDDLTVAGPVRVNLYVSTDRTAADFVVKLVDVQPGRLAGNGLKNINPRGGQQLLVRAEAFRGRFRNSYERPEPFKPGQVARISYDLPDILHTFKRGHRVMVQVQSTWFPLIDRNPQKYVPSIFKAKASDYVTATHTVHRSKAHPSHLVLNTLR